MRKRGTETEQEIMRTGGEKKKEAGARRWETEGGRDEQTEVGGNGQTGWKVSSHSRRDLRLSLKKKMLNCCVMCRDADLKT